MKSNKNIRFDGTGPLVTECEKCRDCACYAELKRGNLGFNCDWCMMKRIEAETDLLVARLRAVSSVITNRLWGKFYGVPYTEWSIDKEKRGECPNLTEVRDNYLRVLRDCVAEVNRVLRLTSAEDAVRVRESEEAEYLGKRECEQKHED